MQSVSILWLLQVCLTESKSNSSSEGCNAQSLWLLRVICKTIYWMWAKHFRLHIITYFFSHRECLRSFTDCFLQSLWDSQFFWIASCSKLWKPFDEALLEESMFKKVFIRQTSGKWITLSHAHNNDSKHQLQFDAGEMMNDKKKFYLQVKS